MRCGDFRETYAEDMAIFESPLPRWLLGALVVFLATLPFWATSTWQPRAVIMAWATSQLTGLSSARSTRASNRAWQG